MRSTCTETTPDALPKLWEEKSPSAKNPTRKTTQVVADNMFAAKDKARQRIRGNVKVSNMTAVKIG